MSQVETCRKTKVVLDRLLAPAFGVVALVVYLATLSKGVFPGTSADLVAMAAGMEPRTTATHPIWYTIAHGLAGLPFLDLPLRLNLFSAVCAALAVALIYRLVSHIVHLAIDPQEDTARQALRASVLAGAMAAIAMAFSVPLWSAGTRLHVQSFEIMFLMVVATIFLAYTRSQSPVYLGLFAFLYGLGCAESTTFLSMAPIFVIYIFHFWLRVDRVRMVRLFVVMGLAILGLGLHLAGAWQFAAQEDFQVLGYTDFWSVVRNTLRAQSADLRGALAPGWLLILLLTAAPWVTALMIATRALNEEREWSYYLLHGTMTICVVVVITNTPVSPWGLLGPQDQLPVASYTLMAMVAGYLVAYWYMLLANRTLVRVHGEKALRVRTGTWLGFVVTWPLMLTVLAAAFINGFQASGHRGAYADACAREILARMGDRRWIVTDGLLDNHLRIEARRRGLPIETVALQNNEVPAYIRHVRRLVDTRPEFASLNRTRLKNSADLGVLTFLQDWFAADQVMATNVVVFSAPDLLAGCGMTVLPEFLAFAGVHDREALKTYPFLDNYIPFWSRMDKMLPRVPKTRDPVALRRNDLRRQIGFVANNLGVLLDELGRAEEAYQVYRRVRTLDPENASALLNLVEMVGRGLHPEIKDALEKEAREFVAHLSGRLPIWSLSRYYGYVRSPTLFVQIGWTWAMSGQPGLAQAGLKRALDLAPSSSRSGIKQAMADMLLQQDEPERSESIYAEILQGDPENSRAMVSLARLSARKGALDTARDWLTRAQTAGADKTRLALEWAAISLMSGDPEKARLALTEVTELQPKNMQALGMLAVAMLQQNETDEVEKRVLPKMESVAGTPDHYLVQVTRGQLAFRKGKENYNTAREAFERAAALRPGVVVLLEWILRLDFLLDDKAQAERHARQILRVNRDNSFANYVMGSLMMERGRGTESEEYLRRSLLSTRTAASLNDLAELLRQNGKIREAEDYARAAVNLAPDLYNAWDTLGGVLVASKRYDEAEEAFNKALDIFKDDLRVHLNLALLLQRRGNLVRAREIVTGLLLRRLELPPKERADLDRLASQLSAPARR